MMKRFDSTNDWFIYDNTRMIHLNVTDLRLSANQSSAENTQTSNQIDMLSNGFKCRGSEETNTSGGTYIFMAFAESPLVNSNGVPNNAR